MGSGWQTQCGGGGEKDEMRVAEEGREGVGRKGEKRCGERKNERGEGRGRERERERKRKRERERERERDLVRRHHIGDEASEAGVCDVESQDGNQKQKEVRISHHKLSCDEQRT
jgi:hypothetical protein